MTFIHQHYISGNVEMYFETAIRPSLREMNLNVNKIIIFLNI